MRDPGLSTLITVLEAVVEGLKTQQGYTSHSSRISPGEI